VCHIAALLFTLKSILRPKKNYANSNISPCKNVIFKKKSLAYDIFWTFGYAKNPSRYHNSTLPNLKFEHKPKYDLSKILV
jgi:hypothetical protein